MPTIGRTDAGSSVPDDDITLTAAESQEAKGALKSAAADGSISTGEIQATEKKLTTKYGADKARVILLKALGQDPAKIDFKAVDWLQGKMGSMDGHIARLQDVLSEDLKGAHLLDANFDGKLDKNDLVFTKDAAGKVNVQKIGQAMSDKVRIGGAMVDAAHSMADANIEFGDLKANSALWKVGGGSMGTMTLKPGIKPSDAIKDVFANPKKYQFECATALVTLRYKAILDLIGEKDFNRIMGDLKIGPWEQEKDAADAWKVRGKGQDGKVAASDADIKNDLKPGDYSYFKNWSVSLAGYNGGWQGENVIYLGKGMYYGHPFGIVSGKEIVDYLNQNRNTSPNRKSASLLDLRASLDPSILKNDRTPG